jgi:hypothetical protein
MNNSIISNIMNNSLRYIIYPEAGVTNYAPSQTTGSNYKFDFHKFLIFCNETI